MCGISGFSNLSEHYTQASVHWNHVLEHMNRVQKHRGPDGSGTYLEDACGLAHVRLSIIDLSTGQQPLQRFGDGGLCTIVYNGEIYNMKSLKRLLEGEGISFSTSSDTEVILAGYMHYGTDFVSQLNGIFAFAIWDARIQKLFLFRDRLGVKPLFFTRLKDTLIFSSEIKGLFAYPGCYPQADRETYCEIFGLGPAKSYGKGVFKNIQEVLPGYYMEFDSHGLTQHCYWHLDSKPHLQTYEDTVEHTRFLITDAVRMQMLSDVPISTFLSGGVDSSLVTAICAKELQKQGQQLDTYSFDFKDNHLYFEANSFQPSEDRPWVDAMVEYAKTNHHYLECCNTELITYLFDAVDARDLPCMADVESSMLYFCRQVAQNHKVALTGECADEIFGGYPWFHKQECFDCHGFPWSMDLTRRTFLLKDDFAEALHLPEYVTDAYEKTIAKTPQLPGENATEKRRREIAFLNLKWFMVTLLDRCDRTSMYSGLEARVPFADHRIVEYIWNVPWDMKCKDGTVKGLLRAAGEGLLPDEVLYRRKSPYPKTYDPAYENRLKEMILEVIHDTTAPITRFLDRTKVLAFLNSPSDYGKPFYGQLMAGPQLLAYLLQINYWMEKYGV